MRQNTYITLLAQARRLSRRAEEAEDLLHAVLLAALEAGRGDLNKPENRRWMHGAMRNHAAFEARSALRRRAREAAFQPAASTADQGLPHGFLTSLPPALRTTALLALTGHTRAEIRHLLGLSDAALRQRIAQIRHRWRALGSGELPHMPGLSGTLPFGLIRQALRPSMTTPQVHLGSHDPDGHLFVISHAHKTQAHGNV